MSPYEKGIAIGITLGEINEIQMRPKYAKLIVKYLVKGSSVDDNRKTEISRSTDITFTKMANKEARERIKILTDLIHCSKKDLKNIFKAAGVEFLDAYE